MPVPLPGPRSIHSIPERFAPKLPFDPFHPVDKLSPLQEVSWSLNLHSSPSLHLVQLSNVILLLGDVTAQNVQPLLTSPFLQTSLLIIASPSLRLQPLPVYPAVRIIRLQAPLSVHDAGAERLVNTLQYAERLAASWRAQGGWTGIQEIDERDLMHSLAKRHSTLGRHPNVSTNADPNSAPRHLPRVSSATSLSLSPSLPRPLSSTRSSYRLSSSSSISSIGSYKRLPPHSRIPYPAFDAILNFLPSTDQLPAPFVLKNAILVTTISRPFLIPGSNSVPVPPIPPVPTPAAPIRERPRTLSLSTSRWSLFRSSQSQTHLPSSQSASPLSTPVHSGTSSVSSLYSTLGLRTPSDSDGEDGPGQGTVSRPSSPPKKRSKIIHILPSSATPNATPQNTKLVQSIENFLLSFGSPSANHSRHPTFVSNSLPSRSPSYPSLSLSPPMIVIPRAIPYVIDEEVWTSHNYRDRSDGHELVIPELVLGGWLDSRGQKAWVGKDWEKEVRSSEVIARPGGRRGEEHLSVPDTATVRVRRRPTMTISTGGSGSGSESWAAPYPRSPNHGSGSSPPSTPTVDEEGRLDTSSASHGGISGTSTTLVKNLEVSSEKKVSKKWSLKFWRK